MSKKPAIKKKILPPNIPPTLQAANLKVRQPGLGKYVSYEGLLSYGQVAFGDKQVEHSAPLIVPPGFATQVPYNSAINSTIIQNSSAIPVTTFYQAMIGDPLVYSCMLWLITTIIARVGDYRNPDKECQELVRRTLKRIGKTKLLQALLTSLWAGFAAIKLNWGFLDDFGEYHPYLDEENYTSIKNIIVMPPDSVMLAVVPEGELDNDFGVMQYYYNLNSEWNQNQKAFSCYGNAPFAAFGGTMSPQRQVAFNPMFLSAIPKEWRILHTFNPTGLAGNFWGVSMVQSIFSNMVDKNNLKLKIQVAATFKAAPMVIFRTDTQTEVVVQGSQDTISMAENLQRTLAGGATTGFYIIEGMHAVEHDVIDNTAKLDEMKLMMEHYNDEIRTGLVTPNLFGNNGSFANAKVNSSNNQTIINSFAMHLIETVENQLVKPQLDFGIGDIKDYGHFELLDNDLDDRATWANLLKIAQEMGGVMDMKSLDDVNFIRKKIGLPEVDQLSDDMIFGAAMAMQGGRTSVDQQKTKEMSGAPYAGGMKKVTDRTYSTAA